MSDCLVCGRDDGHYIGCEKAPGRYDPLAEAVLAKLDESEKANRCAKHGCTNRRAVSKGPRPAKYCDEHKTGSKK
jgi:hypothetical protein